jgi:Kef-type K+ transport system membrane component KefB
MTFGVLALVVAAGLAGPLLAFGRRAVVPVVVGELAAGIVIGRTGTGWLDTTDSTTAFMADVGFAMLMFSAGMHVPIRQAGIRRGLRRGALAAVVTAALAVPLGLAVHAALGGLAVAASAAAVLALARRLGRYELVHRFRHESKTRGWALDLRLSLLVLFALAWLATRAGTSILIAGFAVGLVVAVIGGPKRLSRQVTGIAAGFFVPLYFVVLGARLDLRALFAHGSSLALAGLLLAAGLVAHLTSARLTRQPAAAGLAATAQLGVPAGVATLGLQQHTLGPGPAAAIVLAALGTIAISALGVALLARRAKAPTR